MNLLNLKYLNIFRLLHNEKQSLDSLVDLQSRKLCKLVRHAYNTVPFYTKLFKNKGLHPNDIQSVEDISKIPIIDKQLLIQTSYDELISNKYQLDKLIPIKTAGSNGMPFVFYIDHTFDQLRKAQFLRPYLTNGRRLRENSISFNVHEPPPKKWFQYLSLLPSTNIHSGIDINDQIQIIQKTKPAVLQGYGSILNLLAVKIIEDKISISKPRLLFTDSELLTHDMRKNIENAFQSKVIDIYGTFETDNIAYECNQHEGFHIAMDCVIMEFINNENSSKTNEEGEIVVTVLNNFAMPFIRYNLHDIGSYSEKLCTCGRTFPLINQIMGRTNDYMIREDGKKLSFFNIADFEKLAPKVREYQIVQEDLDTFKVFIVPGISYNNYCEIEFSTSIKKFFPNAKIIVNMVSKIEREPSGKFRTFKSKVNIE